MKNFFKLILVFEMAIGFTGMKTIPAWAQEQDLRFRAVEVRGNVMAYHNENDETARLYTSQAVDDGDKVITSSDSEAVLRISQKAYLFLGPRTKVNIMRLRQGDQGPQCRVNLVTGRMLCQLDQPQGISFEVVAGSVSCHEHGTLFEISRKEEELRIVSFEGGIVADFHGKTKMAKTNEALKLDHGKFRNITHHLTQGDQDHLKSWQGLLAKIQGNSMTPSAR